MGKTEWEKALLWLSTHGHTPSAAEATALKDYFEKNPEQLVTADKYGWLPLHCAAGHQRGDHAASIVATLLTASPDAAEKENRWGEVPLHVAAEKQSGIDGAAIVTLLLTASPLAAQRKDNFGNMPIDLAQKHTSKLPASCMAVLREAAHGTWQPGAPKGTTSRRAVSLNSRSLRVLSFVIALSSPSSPSARFDCIGTIYSLESSGTIALLLFILSQLPLPLRSSISIYIA